MTYAWGDQRSGMMFREHEFGPDGLPRFHRAVRLRLNMDCEDPYPFELVARESAYARKPKGLMVIWGLSRCRKCDACAERRSRLWAGKALDEYRVTADRGGRTWLGTFTLSPEKHQEFDWRLEVGSLEDGRSPLDIFALPEAQRFAARASIIGDEITKWLKRVRKGQLSPMAGGHWRPKLRYLLIAEAHDGECTSDVIRGRPHFHILLHEQKAGQLLIGDLAQAMTRGRSYELYRRRVFERGRWEDQIWASNVAWIKRAWEHGHSSFRLCVDARSAIYPCKYLTKAMRLRVRASQGYGGGSGEPTIPTVPPWQEGLVKPSSGLQPAHTTPPPGGGGGQGELQGGSPASEASCSVGEVD